MFRLAVRAVSSAGRGAGALARGIARLPGRFRRGSRLIRAVHLAPRIVEYGPATRVRNALLYLRGEEELSGAPDLGPIADDLGALEIQATYAMALSLTRTVQSAQRRIRDGLGEHFQLRRPGFVKQGIVIEPATKEKLEASVSSRDDFMARHEEGGTRRPRGQHLAVPTGIVTLSGRRLVPSQLRPREALKRSRSFFLLRLRGEDDTALRGPGPGPGVETFHLLVQRERRRRRPETERARRERLGLPRFHSFEVRRASGASRKRRGAEDPILERTRLEQSRDARGRFSEVRVRGLGLDLGPRRSRPQGYRSPPRREDRGIKILYVMARQAELDARHWFGPGVVEALAEFDTHLAEATEIALRTAKDPGS